MVPWLTEMSTKLKQTFSWNEFLEKNAEERIILFCHYVISLLLNIITSFKKEKTINFFEREPLKRLPTVNKISFRQG